MRRTEQPRRRTAMRLGGAIGPREQARLRTELRQAGARSDELDGLVGAAAAVSRLRPAAQRSALVRSAAVPSRPMRFGWRRLAPFAATAAVCLVLAAGVVMAAQSALPGSVLYPVQRLSDRVALAVHPAYRSSLMMARMTQLTAVIDNHGSQDAVVAAARQYQAVAAGYHMSGGAYGEPSGSDYAVVEFCRDGLMADSARTTGAAHQVIEQALAELPRT